MRRLAIAVLGVLAIGAAPASAAQFTVTTTADGGACIREQPCSLRAALALSAQNNEPDTITVPAGTYPLGVEFGELAVTGDVTISGAGANQTAIVGGGRTRVLAVTGPNNRITGVTIRGGREPNDSGGNVVIGHGADLALDHVRLTAGLAARGGGIAAEGGGLLTIRHSLIDNNEALTNGQILGQGGGVFITADNPQTTDVSDTTIAFNRASVGGGILASNNEANRTTLARVTIADNAASGARGGGIVISDLEPVTIEDSIIARNTGNVSDFAVVIGPSNCGTNRPTSAGGNVESATDCGLERQNTTGGLAAALADNGGQTPTLALPWTSDVHDFAGACGATTDQRDLARPAGACDPGAYEAQPPPPPVETPTPGPPPPPPPTVTPTPTPVVNTTIVVAPTEGTVRVKRKGSSTYEPLDVTKGIPVGSTVDTRKGRVRLTSVPKPGAPPESAWFWDGIFRVTQSRGVTNLTLTEQLAKCPKKGRASAAAKKAKKRKLWGDGKGAFRTTGRYSAATVRGTKWLVEDSCSGTLTRVTQGSVTVKAGKVKKIVRAGKRYLARPRR